MTLSDEYSWILRSMTNQLYSNKTNLRDIQETPKINGILFE